MDYTLWVAIVLNAYEVKDFYEHLSMNGYTYDVAKYDEDRDLLIVFEEEFEYVATILKDWNIKYEVL